MCPDRHGDPVCTGHFAAGIVVSRAQGALGLLPFAVRLGGQRPCLLITGVSPVEAGERGAESRGATESGPSTAAGPGGG